MFLNNAPNSTVSAATGQDVLKCDQACLQKLVGNATSTLFQRGLSPQWLPNVSLEFDVLDMWDNGKQIATGNSSIYTTLSRGGASSVYILKTHKRA